MEPIVLGPGAGEVVTDEESSHVVIKAGLDAVAVTESRYAAGESGPGPHVHHEHVDAFYVLDGQLVFETGPEPRTRVVAAPGTFVLVPPEVVHTFRNEGPGDARFLNVHAPSRDFHRQLRGEDVDFDTDDPPPDGGRPASEVVVNARGEGRVSRLGDSAFAIRAGSEDAGARLAAIELDVAPGFPGPVPHRHRAMYDSFYVLEGTLRVRAGDGHVDAPPGAYVLVPPGNVHTFSNPGDAPVRVLNLMMPAGLERYLEEVAAAMRPGEAPDPARMAEIASRYDFEPAA